ETGTAAYIIRQQENQNLLFINQLLAELKFGAYNLDLGASYNIVKADEPDRKTNTFRFVEAENTFYTAGGAQSYNHRYFHNLKENDLAAKAIVDRSFFEDKLKLPQDTITVSQKEISKRFNTILTFRTQLPSV